MPLSLRPLEPATRPAFEALLRESWEPSWDDAVQREIVAWRYRERPSDGRTWLAFDGERCVAMIDSFVRPWLLDGRPVMLREHCDWYCAPSHRPAGIGVVLMRKLMQQKEPIVSVGGTPPTLALLPKLRWAAM